MEETLHSIRRLYRKHLARYAWARAMKQVAQWVWEVYRQSRFTVMAFLRTLSERLLAIRPTSRIAQHLQQNLAAKFSSYLLMSLPEYCRNNDPVVYLLSPAETVVLDMPLIYPACHSRHFHSGTWSLAAPAVQAIEIMDAEVMGKSDLVFTKGLCLHNGLYEFERDLLPEEKCGMIKIDAKRGILFRHVKTHEPVKTLPRAISLIGSTSANYVHWLTEIAPKLALVDEVACLRDLPLIIDADLHPNIMEALHRLNTYKREMVFLRRGQICRVEKLVTITPTAYAPFDYRRGVKPDQLTIDPGWAMFVPYAMHVLRHKLVARLATSNGALRRRLFLRRVSDYRRMHNTGEVEALLRELGFEVIVPQELSFAEQVELFSKAEIIVAQAGAALGNIIFAPPGCLVVILTVWSPYSNYYYFSNLASILNLRCVYVLGTTRELASKHPAYKSFEADIDALKEVIM